MGDDTLEPPQEPREVPDDFDWPSFTQPVPGHGALSDRSWAVLTHLSIFVLGIAFPLAVVLFKGHKSPYVCHHAVQAINFHTTVLLAVLLCSFTSALVVGLLMLPVVLLTAATLAVRAAIRSGHGAWHRYPMSLRFVS